MALNKKEIIMAAAENLFAINGFLQTSTLLIAKEAKVSEALIFKHFLTKEGLLKSILKEGYQKVLVTNKGMLEAKHPSLMIQKIIQLPNLLVTQQPVFWKMQATMINNPIAEQAHNNFMKPVKKILITTFNKLLFPDPENETDLLMLLIDALWRKFALNPNIDKEQMTLFIQNNYQERIVKYNLTK